jgi:hypothetical protein
MGRNCLAHVSGNAINAVLDAGSYNFRLTNSYQSLQF